MALLHDGPDHGVQPGLVPAEDIKGRQGTAVKISEPCADSISIQTMTTMLMGYKRPDYLAKIGRIHAGGETIDMLEDAIEQQPPYISDYF